VACHSVGIIWSGFEYVNNFCVKLEYFTILEFCSCGCKFILTNLIHCISQLHKHELEVLGNFDFSVSTYIHTGVNFVAACVGMGKYFWFPSDRLITSFHCQCRIPCENFGIRGMQTWRVCKVSWQWRMYTPHCKCRELL